MPLSCSLLPHEAADGPANMALDQALLESVADGPSRAVLRTYGWTVATLSLGYFQSFRDAEAEPRWRDVPIVRRPTGGGAIWHHHELTYALVVPVDVPLARRGGTLYHAVHGAIAALLRAEGLPASRRGDPPRPAAAATGRPFLCFSDRDAEDLVAGESKIVGSAQRRRARAVLQHGSILLARSSRIPEHSGVSDLVPLTADPEWWSRIVLESVPGALGLSPIPAEFSSAERARASALERTVYRDECWTRRR